MRSEESSHRPASSTPIEEKCPWSDGEAPSHRQTLGLSYRTTLFQSAGPFGKSRQTKRQSRPTNRKTTRRGSPDGHGTSYGSRSEQTDLHTRDSSPGFGKMPRMKRTYPVLANRSITDRLQTGFRDGPHGKARNEASDRKGASRSRNACETITGLPILPSENRKSELFRLSWACRTRGKRPRRPKTCPIAKLLSHERKEPALHRLVRRRFDGLFRRRPERNIRIPRR